MWLDYQEKLDDELNSYKLMEDEQVEGLQDWIMSSKTREKDAISDLKKESVKR